MKFKEKTEARLFSFKFLYFLLFEKGIEVIQIGNDDLTELIHTFTDSIHRKEQEEPTLEVTEKSLFLSKQIIGKAVEAAEEINQLIKQNSNGKCNKIENAILYTALAEHLSFTDTPKRVIINEYIELGKKFGTKSSAAFINALLDKAIPDND